MARARLVFGASIRLSLILLALLLIASLVTSSGRLPVHADDADVNVDSEVDVNSTVPDRVRRTDTYRVTATLVNTSVHTLISAPVSLVITSITPATVTLLNPTGHTSDGDPFVSVPIPIDGLRPGRHVSLQLTFDNPSGVDFTFESSVLGVPSPFNRTPLARTGMNANVLVGDQVAPDGSDSTDADGDLLTFAWSLVKAPAGSAETLEGPTRPNPVFSPDVPGRYVFELVVIDDQGLASRPKRMTISAFAAGTAPPNARAGRDRTALVGAPVTLDGSESDDPDGSPVTTTWSFARMPDGSALTDAAISQANTAHPTFVPDVGGTYVLSLQVSDGVLTDTDTVRVRARMPNVKPNANAGVDQTALLNETVTLDGRASFDPDAGPGPLTFSWIFVTRPAGSTLTAADLVGETTATPSFTPDAIGVYVFRLTVTDGKTRAADNVLVEVFDANRPPTAVDDAAVTDEAAPVVIDVLANDSDPDPADTLTVESFAKGAGSVTFAANVATYTPNPAFVGQGRDSFTYTISDGRGGSDTATVRVNRRPVAVNDDAGTTPANPVDITVLSNDRDADGDPLSIVSVTQGANGSVVVNPSKRVTYTPNPGFTGPTDSFTYTISDGDATAPAATVTVTVTPLAPTISGFAPSTGHVGDPVTVTGTNLEGIQAISFNGVAGTITGRTPTSISTFVPINARSGPIAVRTIGGTATSAGSFAVSLRQDFGIAIAPLGGTVIQGSSTTYSVELTNTSPDAFTGLATISVAGVPSGVTATLVPSTLTGGQRGSLKISASSEAAIGSAALTLRATAPSELGSITRTSDFTLLVEAAGRTALVGQMLLVSGAPLSGVHLSMGDKSTQSDAGGNFMLLDVPPGVQTLSIDATPADPTFPIYGVDVTLVAGQTTRLDPFRISPPPTPDRFVPIQNTTQDQVVADPRFPGASIMLRAGVTVTGWEGARRTKVAIARFSPDQLPMPPPPGPTRSLYQFHFGSNMGGVPSAPLPITLPNDQGLDPGDKAEIWYYDAVPFPGVPAAWRLAGLGTVSADGTAVVSDPGVGISRFCGVCGTACIIRMQNSPENPAREPEAPSDADPVDLALGQMIAQHTDLVLPGRIPATIHRTYNPFDPFGGIAGFQLGLGPGWALSIEIVLLELNASIRRIVLPGNARFEFHLQSDGSFVNTTHMRFAGAVLTPEGAGRHRLRYRDGTVWRFTPGPLAGLSVLAEQTDRNSNRLRIEREGSRIVRLVEPAGRALTFTYDGGRIIEIRDPIGRTVRYGYDGLRLATVTDPLGGVTRYTYDGGGRLLSITDPRGITYLVNEYDASGRVVKQTHAEGGTWGLTYSGAPNSPGTVTVTDPQGNTTAHELSPQLLARGRVDALGQPTILERNTQGFVTVSSDPLGRITSFSFDDIGNLIGLTDAAGETRTLTYDPAFNRIASVTDALGHVRTFEYDARGNLISAVDPMGNITRITYNSFGQPVSTTDPLGHVTTFAYDEHGNLATVRDATGNMTRRQYDAASRLVAETDPRGRTTTYTRDAADRIIAIRDPAGGLTLFSHDPNGNLISVTDARGNTTTYSYDAMDRVVSRRDPAGALEHFDYDAAGNLIRHRDRNGGATAYTFDRLNRVVAVRYPDGLTTGLLYDAAGRVVRIDDSAAGTILNEYDILDRLVARTSARGVIRYAYDALGRRVQMQAPGQSPVSYTYDDNSRLIQIVHGPRVVRFAYDAGGRRTRLTLPGGVTTEYDYDAASRVTELTYTGPAGTIGNLRYAYDPGGERVRLAGSLARTLLPQPVTTAVYGAGNRQVRFGNREMGFDANGNITSIVTPDGTASLSWDARNRLIRYTEPGLTASFAYDGMGRRAAQSVNGRLIEYLSDGSDVIEEIVGERRVALLRGPVVDELFARSSNEYPIADVLGSSIALVDTMGNVIEEYNYEPFGETQASGSTENSFKYTGREHDATGLYYYRSRYYSPVLHRFLSEDPSGFHGGDAVLYAYVGNNPMNFTDPQGLERERRNCNSGCQVYDGPISAGDPGIPGPRGFFGGGCCTGPVSALFPSNDCSRRPPEDLAGCSAQQRACYAHDVCLWKARAAFWDLSNRDVVKCHIDLCIASTDEYVRAFGCSMSALGSSPVFVKGAIGVQGDVPNSNAKPRIPYRTLIPADPRRPALFPPFFPG